MKRVLIIGRAASGKSTLARQLAGITGLPVIELDRVFWRPGLVETPRQEWIALQQKLVSEIYSLKRIAVPIHSTPAWAKGTAAESAFFIQVGNHNERA